MYHQVRGIPGMQVIFGMLPQVVRRPWACPGGVRHSVLANTQRQSIRVENPLPREIFPLRVLPVLKRERGV